MNPAANPGSSTEPSGAARRGSVVLRRSFEAFLLLFGVFVLAFVLFHLVPTDPARLMLGPNASEDSVRILRSELGLDRSLPVQFVDSLGGILRGDFGSSIRDRQPVLPAVAERFWITARIGFLACAVSLLASYGLVLAAFYFPPLEILLSGSRVWVAVPAFVSATIVALVLGSLFPAIPLSGFEIERGGLLTLLAPACIVAIYPTATMASILHGKVKQNGRKPFYRSARAFGFSRCRLFHREGVRPILNTWLTAWFNQLSLIFFTTFILELVFSIAGIGSLLLEAIQGKDFPTLQGILILNAAFFLAVNWFSELVAFNLDPRSVYHG